MSNLANGMTVKAALDDADRTIMSYTVFGDFRYNVALDEVRYTIGDKYVTIN